MKRLFTNLLILLTLFACIPRANADGVMFPSQHDWNRRRERALISEPMQKAAVLFSNGTEQLIISPSYEGDAKNFAWVVPVPTRPKVEILKGALFHELAELMAPEPEGKEAPAGSVSAPSRAKVTVIERKTVGAYDVSVLLAYDSQALMKWLKTNQYYMPPTAEAPIKTYVKRKWCFVASRINVPENARGLKEGTLAPIRLTFTAPAPVYPMMLSSANPEPFSILVYLMLPADEYGGSNQIQLKTHPKLSAEYTAPNFGKPTPYRFTVEENQTKYQTLASLTNDALHVYVE